MSPFHMSIGEQVVGALAVSFCVSEIKRISGGSAKCIKTGVRYAVEIPIVQNDPGGVIRMVDIAISGIGYEEAERRDIMQFCCWIWSGLVPGTCKWISRCSRRGLR